MPRHSSGTVRKSLDMIRQTRKIRRVRPHWMVCFATARIEGDKQSFIVMPKLPAARSAIKRWGIAGTSSGKLAGETSGYAWFDRGTVWLSPIKGDFASARKAFEGLCKEVGTGCPPIRRGKHLSPAEIRAQDDEDESSIDSLGESLASDDDDDDEVPPGYGTVWEDDEDDADDEQSDDALDETGDDSASDSDTEATLTPPATPTEDISENEDDSEAILTPETSDAELTEDEKRRSARTGKQIGKALGGVLAHAGKDPVTDKLDDMRATVEKRAAQLEGEARAAFQRTAACRLLMAGALTGAGADVDLDERLDRQPPDAPVGSSELVDHFMEIASQTLHAKGLEFKVSRQLIEQRVAGMFDETASDSDKLEAIARITKGLLPALTDPGRLERMFQAKEPPKPGDMDSAAAGTVGIEAALTLAIAQIDACRNAYEDSLEGDDAVSSEDHEYFDDLISDLRGVVDPFVRDARMLAKRMEGGYAVPQNDIMGTRLAATRLRSETTRLAGRIDRSVLARCSIAAEFSSAVAGFLKHLPAAD